MKRGVQKGRKRSRKKLVRTGRKRSRHLEGVTEIDFRDVNLLRKFVTDHGKLMPSRFLGTTAKQQRQVAKAVRRARELGLLP